MLAIMKSNGLAKRLKEPTGGRKDSEATIQAECFKWFWEAFPAFRRLLFHVPNGGYRSIVEAAQFKSIGVIAGIPDLILLLPRKGYASLEIEMKEPNGTLSPEQIEIHEIHSSAGNLVKVAYSVEDFKKIINDYLL